MSEDLFDYALDTSDWPRPTVASTVTDHLSPSRARLVDVGARVILAAFAIGLVISVLIALRIGVALFGIVL